MKTHNENTRAAIVAKYIPASNTRGSRIQVKSQRSRRSYSYPHEKSGDEVFKHAVAEYLGEILREDTRKYGEHATGWGTLADYSVGQIPSGEYVFVNNR
jgi:hypothetical protein